MRSFCSLLLAVFLLAAAPAIIPTAHAADGEEEDNNNSSSSRPTMSRQECLDQGGNIVGDIGDGAIHRDDYICQSSGEPPIGTILPAEGEPIPIEGEVCCGAATAVATDGEDTTVQNTSAAAVVKSVFVTSLMVIPFWNY